MTGGKRKVSVLLQSLEHPLPPRSIIIIISSTVDFSPKGAVGVNGGVATSGCGEEGLGGNQKQNPTQKSVDMSWGGGHTSERL